MKTKINKPKKLTAAQKRVQIAHDVIAQIRSKKLIANTGFILDDQTGRRLSSAKSPAELQKLVKETKSCEVCAKGALLLSTIDRFNTIAPEDFSRFDNDISLDSYNTTEIEDLTKIFPEELLNEIEFLFEGSDICDSFCDGSHRELSEKGYAIQDFYQNNLKELGDKNRLIYIMQMIIAGNGKLVLKELPKEKNVKKLKMSPA